MTTPSNPWLSPSLLSMKEAQVFGTLVDIQVTGINTDYNERREETSDRSASPTSGKVQVPDIKRDT